MLLNNRVSYQTNSAVVRGHGVKFASHGGKLKVVQCNSQGERCHGVAMFDCDSGDELTVNMDLEVEGLSAAAISIAANVTMSANGRFETAAGSDVIFGIAKTAATDANQYIEIVKLSADGVA